MQVVWSPLALRQLDQIFDYLHALNPRAAAEVSAALIAASENLVSFPHRGRPVGQTDLRELIAAYPYIIRYQITREQVRIVRVRHTARRRTKP